MTPPSAPAASSGTRAASSACRFPRRDEAATQVARHAAISSAQEATPPPEVQQAIDGIVALLRGEPRDLTDVTIDDTDTPEFNARVYAIARNIPPGQTMTYGEIAERLGDKLLAREVGTALGQNPCPIVMPCHRVLAAGGKTGGFSPPGGVVTKLKLLIDRRRAARRADLFDACLGRAAPPARLNLSEAGGTFAVTSS